ncbi:Multicopper oxidase elcG [Exophiala dermatitidis]|uniref:Laccase TilA n=1 Tax=Exophiala dermatitidis (strain ATCC 34100 / CBS 525.76 / NIH/UT8656) TaxID=858893 RepID=H6BR26_EXODN|nr:laccase TilA [Exophiala dermatitidis NIH/UT8656]EHY54661.1 laccase TilA [Exophiala dermatitidis NIH/UT8656]
MAFSQFITILSFLSLALFSAAAPSSSSSLQKRGDPVKFEVTLTWEDYSPNGGTPRKMIMTNGTFPGPPLKLKVGDEVEFLVHNDLPDPTAVHFHGIVQQGTPWSDGVPGLTQKPIAPGECYLYKWTADAAGVYFYHSHYRSQMMDGMYGAIIISPEKDSDKPFSLISNDTEAIEAMSEADENLQTVFISDYNKYTSQELHEQERSANIDFACADSILLNGQGSQYCLSRDELTAYTNPKVKALVATVSPSEITDKGCLPPNLAATQGNFTFDIDSIPRDAYFECTPSSGPMATFDVDPAKGWAALTFINPGGFEMLKFTIDSHKMWVYAVDGGYVVPQLVDQITVNNGDRYSVLIKLDQTPAQYSIRVSNSGLNQVISGFGILNYKGSTGPAAGEDNPNALAGMNFAGVNLTTLVPFNDNKAAPYPERAPAPTPDVTYKFNIKKLGQPYGAYDWTLSGIDTFNVTLEDNEQPLLFAKDPNDIEATDLVLKTNLGQWVDLIVQVQGPLAQPHPMHKHSNKAYVLGKGTGTFNWSTVAEAAAELPPNTFNFVNPPLRDGYTTTPAEGNSTWMALRYQVVNPGPFLFHCHMQTHMAGGMAVAFLDGVDQWPEIPPEYAGPDGDGSGNGITSGATAKLKKKAKLHPKQNE